MKKVSDKTILSPLQESFFETDGPSGRGNLLVEFERESFYQITIEDNLYGKKLFNKSYGDISYSKKNNENVIVPNPRFIKPMNFIKGENSSLCFVSKAYQSFVDEWNKLVEQGIIPEQQNIDLIPIKTYTNFEKEYSNLILEYSQTFSLFLEKNKSIEKINNFDSFLKEVSKLISIESKNSPFTVTKFIQSKFCTDAISGMTLELSRKDDNYITKKDFIQSDLFQIYHDLAVRNGFIIDKNNPWKLYFNIKSPAARSVIETFLEKDEKFEKYFYKKFFIETKSYDLYFFKKYIIEMYNFLCVLYPNSKIIKSSNCKNKIKQYTIERNPIRRENREIMMEDDENFDFWKFFIFTKCCEENLFINQAQFNHIAQESYSIYQRLDTTEAVWYFEENTKTLPRSKSKERNFSY